MMIAAWFQYGLGSFFFPFRPLFRTKLLSPNVGRPCFSIVLPVKVKHTERQLCRETRELERWLADMMAAVWDVLPEGSTGHCQESGRRLGTHPTAPALSK
jgi:hypothetical protein